VATFLADLRGLRARAGGPSYADLARRSGLPRSTIYDGLHRKRLPNLELTVALARALDADESEWHQRWVALRGRLEANPPPVADHNTPVAPAWRQKYRWWLVATAAVLIAATASSVTFLVGGKSGSDCQTTTVYRLSDAGNLLDTSGNVLASTTPGDLFVVRKRTTGPYAHRLLGTVESTGRTGYADEAKLDRLRVDCS
jgi:transcriptional regulator with XRE-family HTH domain